MEKIKQDLQFLFDGDGNKSRESYFKKNYEKYHILILEYTSEYKDMKFNCRIWHFYHQTNKKPVCKECQRVLHNFRSIKDGYYTFCSNKCQMLNIEFQNIRKNKIFNKYGVYSTNQLNSVKNKKIKTCLQNYGVTSPMKSELIKKKLEDYNLKTWGVKNVFQSDEIKEKIKDTLIERYGVDNSMKYFKSFIKNRKSALCVHRYKNSNILYQGSYELFFLEKLEEKFGLNILSNIPKFTYILNGISHTYFPDFYIKELNLIIEIKSTWTFNKNGKDKISEIRNITKWNSVKNKNYIFKALFTKKEIVKFINNMIIC